MAGKYDFSGWATKNNILCSDGRTILRDAFADNDGQEVPLVWNHQHNDTKNVLGHALLENRPEGVYAYCSLNNTESGQRAKEFVRNKDVCALSIYANNLKQHGTAVAHGVIREVSLVLAGANPGACIDNVIMHGEEFDDMAVIYSGDETGLDLMHAAAEEDDEKEIESETEAAKDEEEDVEDTKKKKKNAEPEEKSEDDADESEEPEKEDETDEDADDETIEKEVKHSATESTEKENPKMADAKEKTVQDVLDTLTEEQKKVVYALIGAALDENKGKGDNEDMKHNVFETEAEGEVLAHAAMETIIADGKKYGTLKESFLAHAEEYGIENIDWLFPDHKNLENTPGFIKRTPDEWVNTVLNGVKHTPFARIKMMFADIREDEARAKGYIKGNLKKEEVFTLLKRVVDPTTIYKKQKLDRDDILDITDFDVVSWLKAEMRMMLDEEIARAIVFGDGRTALSQDKIDPNKIIPIVSDAALYTIPVTVTPASGESESHAIIKAAVKGQETYEGSGNTTLFTSVSYLTDMLLEEDRDGHRMYNSISDLALAMSVNKIVKVPASIIPADVYGVIVDLRDYTIGADKGGSINMFDDFDIDYNQQKYLMETRCSGALTKPYSAVVLKKANAAG